MKLSWIFKPAKGYDNSIIYALDENGNHVAHINCSVDGCGFWFFGTIREMEDNDELGGESGSETIQEAMEVVQYYFDHCREFPKGYYSGG